jgi:hypothetical protein
MLGLEFVRPLEDDWRATLDAVAAARGWPTSRDPRRLAECVAELSAAYNDGTRARAGVKQAGAARLSFSFVRDVPKGASAVRELVAAQTLRGAAPDGDVIRVLDVGAGLGAMTWGLARALDASGRRTRIEATWVDADADAIDVGRAILRGRSSRAGSVQLEVRTEVAALESLWSGPPPAGARTRPPFDVVFVGQVLSELDVGESDATRVERHAGKLAGLLDAYAAPSGFLVVVEPALRDRTRHLHRVRDALVAPGDNPDRSRAIVFAPCLHEAPCPALAQPRDWCHEDLPIDLPPWLVPIARGAGLRYQGLTFSYLILRREGPGLDALLGARPGARLRAVSNRKATKGKTEVLLCGDFSAGPVAAAESAPGRDPEPCRTCACVARLDRDAAGGNRAWDGIVRGDIAIIDPPPERGPGGAARVRSTSTVALVDATSLAHAAPVGAITANVGSSDEGKTR